jgi:outer membrane receptor protein involved in Fe transport
MRSLALLALLGLAGICPAHAEEYKMEAVMDTVRVTATWAPLAPQMLPETVTVVQGEELRRRGARDLRSALALVAGVEAVPGGDAGPAGSVPALWGLREFDAFLLVVDGVPWGGAFIPNLPTLDLNDVERVEILRGPAPITYGSTSFVGVIHVYHRQPGAGTRVGLEGGSYGTVRGSAALDVAPNARLALDGARERFADDDAGVDRGHARARVQLARGIQVDADAAVVHQDPTSPVARVGNGLDPAIPLDANHNPKDAKLDTTRFQLSATQATKWLDWVGAVSHAKDENARGFLEDGATDDGSTPNANGYTQDRDLTEFYGEGHHRFVVAPGWGVTVGGDALFGRGKENSRNFRYYAPLDGRGVQSSADGATVEDTEFEAERFFLGLATEADWHPAEDWTVLAGVRLNRVEETREGESEVGGVDTPAKITDEHVRLGGRLGITWEAWQDDDDDLSLYVDGRDTFKPAAIDFGPEAEVNPLDPETAVSVEVGARSTLAGGRLHVDASAFRMDFENLVVATIVNGNPALANAGKERFDGVELDAEAELAPGWRLVGTYAWHDATFRDYEQTFDGVLTRLDGNRLELSPAHLASAGLAYAGPVFHAQAFANYVGERYLNRRNTAKADAYATFDASAGAVVGGVDLRVTGRNLSDRRDPVAESELGESQFYRLPARTVEVSVSRAL